MPWFVSLKACTRSRAAASGSTGATLSPAAAATAAIPAPIVPPPTTTTVATLASLFGDGRRSCRRMLDGPFAVARSLVVVCGGHRALTVAQRPHRIAGRPDDRRL